MNEFEKKIAGGLGNWSAGSLFLIAVSGGADSTALLSAMTVIAGELNFRLHCLHVEHGIRAEAERRGDAEAVERLCGGLGVPCTVTVIPPGIIERTAKERGTGMEAAARHFRRTAWKEEMERIRAERVLTAHTGDDLLETILMRFLRGSGPAGLAGMKREQNRVLRPMLSLRRSDVLRYLEERAVPYRTDSTNNDIHYLRNRIRLKLVPVLNELFPEWEKNALAGAETQRYIADFLEHESFTRIRWTENAEWERGPYGKKPLLSAKWEEFFSLPEIVREEVIFQAIDRINDTAELTVPPRRSALRLFCRGIKNAVDTGTVRILKEKGRVVIMKQEEFSERGCALLIKKPGTYIIGKEKIEVSKGPFPVALHSTGNGKIAAEYIGGSNGE
jgi:tRNA(Ile)-lysidine synthase